MIPRVVIPELTHHLSDEATILRQASWAIEPKPEVDCT